MKASKDQRHTQNRNSLHEAIRRSMRQSYKAADYQARSKEVIVSNTSKVLGIR